jgi:hypothetical protein
MRIFFAFILLLISSCNKTDISKINGIQWDPNMAAPIGYSDFDVYDILASQDKNDLLVISDLGELALNYSGEIASVSADQIAQLGNQSIDLVLSPSDQGIYNIPSFNKDNSITNNVKELLNFDLSKNVELKEVFLHSGKLNFKVSTELKHDVIFNISLPDITKNGTPVTQQIQSNYTGNSPHDAFASIDLSGYKLDLTAGGNVTKNGLSVDITTTINGTGNPISGTETSSINFGFKEMTIDKAIGYFGQQSIISESDSIILKIFENSTTGTIQLTNPKLKFKVVNSFGIPVQMNITNLKSINTNTGVTTPLISNVLNNITINAPSIPGDSSLTNLTLNQSNTPDLDELVNNTPKYLNYTINAITNPNNIVNDNFITREGKLKVHAELELPLEGYAYDFMITDTLPFNFSDQVDQVESVMLRLFSENRFPISFQSRLEFLDEKNTSLFTLLADNPNILDAAPVDENGKVIGKAKKTKDIVINKEYINLLSNVKNIVIKGTVATTQPQGKTVKIYDNYNLKLKLSMQVKLKLNL